MSRYVTHATCVRIRTAYVHGKVGTHGCVLLWEKHGRISFHVPYMYFTLLGSAAGARDAGLALIFRTFKVPNFFF